MVKDARGTEWHSFGSELYVKWVIYPAGHPSGVYHYQGERYFGSTKQGKFMCEKAAVRKGDRPTRNVQ